MTQQTAQKGNIHTRSLQAPPGSVHRTRKNPMRIQEKQSLSQARRKPRVTLAKAPWE